MFPNSNFIKHTVYYDINQAQPTWIILDKQKSKSTRVVLEGNFQDSRQPPEQGNWYINVLQGIKSEFTHERLTIQYSNTKFSTGPGPDALRIQGGPLSITGLDGDYNLSGELLNGKYLWVKHDSANTTLFYNTEGEPAWTLLDANTHSRAVLLAWCDLFPWNHGNRGKNSHGFSAQKIIPMVFHSMVFSAGGSRPEIFGNSKMHS